MIPEPTTAATRVPAPTASAATRRVSTGTAVIVVAPAGAAVRRWQA